MTLKEGIDGDTERWKLCKSEQFCRNGLLCPSDTVVQKMPGGEAGSQALLIAFNRTPGYGELGVE